MHIRGTIFHHPRLVFHDGFTSNKYLILLNTPQKKDPYFFVKTTSQKKDKPETPGCIKKDQVFFIESKLKTFFSLPTWVQLFEHYIFESDDIKKNKEMQVKGSLDSNLVDKIIDCLFLVAEDDLSPEKEKILRPPLQDSIRMLAEKFKGC